MNKNIHTALLAAACFFALAASKDIQEPSPSSPSSPLTSMPRIPAAIDKGRPIRIVTYLDKAVIRVGDLVHYSLVIEAPAGSKIAMPPPGAQLGEFLIRDYSFPGLEEKQGSMAERFRKWLSEKTGIPIAGTRREKSEFHFTITAYDTGDLVIPPLPVMVTDPRGKNHLLFAESARVRVVPVTNPEDLTIKDIKAPAVIAFPWTRIIPYLLAPFALAGIALIALRLMAARKEEAFEGIALRPPHEIAQEELKQLEQEELLEKGEYEKFYTRLSWILRKYLALRFSIYALEYTTAEILARLRTGELGHADYEKLRGLLEEADLVKFARWTPDPDKRNTALERTRQIIESTKQQEEPMERRQAA